MLNITPQTACYIAALIAGALGLYIRLMFSAELAKFELRLDDKYVRKVDCPRPRVPRAEPAETCAHAGAD